MLARRTGTLLHNLEIINTRAKVLNGEGMDIIRYDFFVGPIDK